MGGDQLILADAVDTMICVLLSISTARGLGLYALTGAARLTRWPGSLSPPSPSREGREAWEGEFVEDDEPGPN